MRMRAAPPSQVHATRGESLGIFDRLRTDGESARLKLTLMSPSSATANTGYAWGLACFCIFLGIAPLILSRTQRGDGIPVRVLAPGVLRSDTDRTTTGLLVYVARSGKLYLNSKPVTEKELPGALEHAFALRADWSVYVEGDPELPYAAVVRAMDQIRSAGGKVIMLTPGMRAEAQSALR